MRVLGQLKPAQAVLSEVPTAIWMPTACFAQLPSCYQGTPLDMVRQMAHEMGPRLDVHDAIDLLIQFLSEQRDIHIHLPAADEDGVMPEEMRAAYFVAILLDSGVAERMPAA